MHKSPLKTPLSEHVWRSKYCWSEGVHMQEPCIEATWDRVALAVSGAEANHHNEWRERFRAILTDFRFLPGGRILASAGTSRRATLFNCFVMGPMEDSLQGIFNALREAMVTLQAGGGVGLDFSSLRPAGAQAAASGSVASGPVSFMSLWEAACTVLESGNLRRCAMVATLRCDHPDIEAFIDAKRAGAALPHFNLSVLLSDDFMRAVEDDDSWALVFPVGEQPMAAETEVCQREWSGSTTALPCRVYRRVSARVLWDKLLAAEHASAAPGVLFIDRINRDNNLWYCERVSSINPCGEVPLPPYGACNLGSINLSRFVQHPFTKQPKFDFGSLAAVTSVATRFLDNVHEISMFALKAQEKVAGASRRIGLGVTGLADLFAMLGLRYGSPASVALTGEIMGWIRDTAYRTSIGLAREKGVFPEFDSTRHGAGSFVLGLSYEIQDAIARHGIRNSHLLAVAPTRSVSLLANNISCGMEPMLAFKAVHQVRGADGRLTAFEVENAACYDYRALNPPTAGLPAYFVQAQDLSVEEQLQVMAAAQASVDNAVSNAVRLPASATAHDHGVVLRRAWALGLKGCVVLRCSP